MRRGATSDWAVFRRVLGEVRGHWRHIGVILLVDLVGTPLALLTPVPLKIAVDSILGDEPLPQPLRSLVGPLTGSKYGGLVAVSVLLLVIVALNQFQKVAAYLLRVRAGEGVTLAFQVRLFGHAQRLSLGYHDRRGTSDSIYRVQYDTYSLWNMAIDKVPSFLASAVMLGAMMYITVRISWQLAAVALIVAPVLLFISYRYTPRVRVWHHESKELETGALHVIHEVLTSLRVVKSFGREDFERRRFERQADKGVRSRVRLALAESTFDGLVNLTLAAGTAAVLFIGVRSVQAGTLTLGSLLLVMAYLVELYGPLETVSRQVGDLQESLVGARRAFELLDQEPDVAEAPEARALERARGKIEFRDVTFSYDGQNPVVDHVTFVVEPGTKLGIAGRTGAGKSTLVSLVSRLYDVSDGSVLLDDVDVREYRVRDLRNQFAVVLQDPVLFSATIAENIRYARPDAEFSEVVHAARAANAHDFITALPDGYGTAAGERGMMLSGGERQRISLARAFLKDAPILILDEPTSSVDVGTESLIMEALERLMAGRTVLMIAHRLGTLDMCDAHLVLEGGRLVSTRGNVLPGDKLLPVERRPDGAADDGSATDVARPAEGTSTRP